VKVECPSRCRQEKAHVKEVDDVMLLHPELPGVEFFQGHLVGKKETDSGHDREIEK